MPIDLTIAARKNRIIVLEELNYVWDKHELKELTTMWTSGVSVEEISRHFDRDPDEVILAIMHLAREDKIAARATGLRGELV
ncbi:hypothetical protein J1P26_07325 [Neobacillus sp. MM2021_6]|uniref:hypothetical protein n=1 Tax=Bacillaceae TaxID=186817 RepID=UPI001408E54B|nr:MULTISPECIES: hypothetical protein [Bacillaceae]MBO0959543.1 hypothetical protein [Neobacillus sp. MM2021_6]NHC17159.1 hypothetical protein [Bacillus sp. MM2020_4]